jgi:hypothetical protein
MMWPLCLATFGTLLAGAQAGDRGYPALALVLFVVGLILFAATVAVSKCTE